MIRPTPPPALRVLAVLVGVLSGCAVTEETFPPRMAEAWCDAYLTCDERRFWEVHPGGPTGCRETTTDRVSDEAFGPNRETACTWVPEGAHDCLGRLKEANCDQIGSSLWFDDCASSAWDCVTLSP